MVKIKVGESYIKQERVMKLLGVQVDDELGWKDLVHGKGGLISSLNNENL